MFRSPCLSVRIDPQKLCRAPTSYNAGAREMCKMNAEWECNFWFFGNVQFFARLIWPNNGPFPLF